jgi:hypothetical protein
VCAKAAPPSHMPRPQVGESVTSGECLQTLDISKALFNILVDITGSYLHTKIGIIAINALLTLNITPSVTDPQNPRY